jgi:hypothetical protein
LSLCFVDLGRLVARSYQQSLECFERLSQEKVS